MLRKRPKADDRKDKAGEKLAESEEDLLEHRADGTDASTRCTSAARNSHIQTPSAVPCRSVAFLAEAKH